MDRLQPVHMDGNIDRILVWRLEVVERWSRFPGQFGGFGECPIFCVSVIWSMLPERSKDDDDFERTAGRTAEGLQAA